MNFLEKTLKREVAKMYEEHEDVIGSLRVSNHFYYTGESAIPRGEYFLDKTLY
jgi:hypothetical protein